MHRSRIMDGQNTSSLLSPTSSLFSAPKRVQSSFSFEPLRYEIEEILVTDRLPEKWTYPDIQPRLLDAARSFFQRRSAAAF